MISVEIEWSVWDKSPLVKWRWKEKTVSLNFENPPLAVVPLPSHRLVAIAADWQDYGSNNLLLYSFDGILHKSFGAPDLGDQSRFGSVQEIDGGATVEAVIAYFKGGHWLEMAGILDIQNGTMSNFHRAY
jgi:hypothetical protein